MRKLLLPFLTVAAAFAGGCDDSPSGNGTDTTTGDTSTNDVTDTNTGDTNVQTDTTPGDTTQGDKGNGLCPGIIGCLSACGQNATCQQGCIASADAGEGALFQGFYQCLDSKGCLDAATDAEFVTCQSTNCLTEIVECQAGTTFGTGTCLPIASCVSACANDDFRCSRNCFAGATEAAATAFFELQFCFAAQCPDEATFQTCAQQSIATGGPCSAAAGACQGGAGAAPGAAAGGGFDGAKFFSAMKARKAAHR